MDSGPGEVSDWFRFVAESMLPRYAVFEEKQDQTFGPVVLKYRTVQVLYEKGVLKKYRENGEFGL